MMRFWTLRSVVSPAGFSTPERNFTGMSFFLLPYDSIHPKNILEATEAPFLREEAPPPFGEGPALLRERRGSGGASAGDPSPSDGVLKRSYDGSGGIASPCCPSCRPGWQSPPMFRSRGSPLDRVPGAAHVALAAAGQVNGRPDASRIGPSSFPGRYLAGVRSMRRLAAGTSRSICRITVPFPLRSIVRIRTASSRKPHTSTISCSGLPA